MDLKTISNENLKDFVDAIIGSGVETYGVQQKDATHGKFHYAKLTSADALRLDYDVTLTPPKKYFTPEKECLMKFNVADKNVDACYDDSKKVLIGVHPYDMIAINQMDQVFKDGQTDAHYFKRRDNTVIIGVDPQSASKWSFWCLVDAGKVDNGYDIWLTKLDDNTYIMQAATPAGEELINKHAKTETATEDQINKRDHIRTELHSVCDSDRKLGARPGEISQLVKDNWDHKVWEEKAAKCYSCGSCNLVCPTCYCFDVKDNFEIDLNTGTRERVWDGCLLQGFAEVGHGENFRGAKVDRFKHRLYRKTVYQFEKYNHLACVGCGRCSSVCLPNIADPVDTLNAIKEGK